MKRSLVIIPVAALGLLMGIGLIAESRGGETATPTVTPTCAPRYYTEGAHIVGEFTDTTDICN